MPENDIKLRAAGSFEAKSRLNLEMRFETVEASSRRLIRSTSERISRFPKIDRDAWWLHLEGEVEKPFAINTNSCSS